MDTPREEEGVTVAISTVMFGQQVETESGTQFADKDTVQLVVREPGHRASCANMTPEEAIAVGKELTAAAARIISKGVDDNGRPVSLADRLRRIHNAGRLS